VFLTRLPVHVWDILVAQIKGILLFGLDLPDLKGEDYFHGILYTTGYCVTIKHRDLNSRPLVTAANSTQTNFSASHPAHLHDRGL
jgi:hypothetical protein